MEKTPRSRKSLLVALLVAVLVLSVLISLKVDFDNRDRLFQNVIKDSPDAMEAFEKLSEMTPSDAVILSWWDYGRAIQEFGGRRPVVAYPSRDIFQSVGASQNPIYALEMQLFGTFEPSDRIHGVARSFLLPEDQSLVIMRKYEATHVMVFHGEDEPGAFNDLEKLPWIARIAGYNASDYVRANSPTPIPTYELTPKAEQATMLRLLFDERFHPQHFTKIYENRVAKIYRIEYSTAQSTGSPDPFSRPRFRASETWAPPTGYVQIGGPPGRRAIIFGRVQNLLTAFQLTHENSLPSHEGSNPGARIKAPANART